MEPSSWGSYRISYTSSHSLHLRDLSINWYNICITYHRTLSVFIITLPFCCHLLRNSYLQGRAHPRVVIGGPKSKILMNGPPMALGLSSSWNRNCPANIASFLSWGRATTFSNLEIDRSLGSYDLSIGALFSYRNSCLTSLSISAFSRSY